MDVDAFRGLGSLIDFGGNLARDSDGGFFYGFLLTVAFFIDGQE